MPEHLVCTAKSRIDAVSKRNHEILAAIHYKPLYNINRSENGVRNIQATAYNGARMVFGHLKIHICIFDL